MTTISAESSCCLPASEQTCSMSTDALSPLVDRDVNKIVRKKLATSNFHIAKWSLDPLEETNGFLGQYFCLNVLVKVDEKVKSLRFFAKTPPPVGNPQYEFLVRFDTFNKEIAVYNDVFSRLGKGDGPKWMPECYLTKNNIIMVLEDARVEGYVTPNKYVPFDEEHCICVARALSIFHSRSLIMDEKLRRSTGRTILDLYGHLLDEVLFVDHDERSQKFLSACISGACAIVDNVGEIKSEERQGLKDSINKLCTGLSRLLEPSKKYRNIMCHRDVWVNNLLLKYDAAGKPAGCYIIDFQFLRYCPPSYDFIFFLYLTTDRATRNRCFDSLARIYHDSMRQQLATEGLDIEDCLPWTAFLESCAEARKVALAYALMNLQIMLLSSEAVKEYFGESADQLEEVLYSDKRVDLVNHQYHTVPSYKSRLREVVLEIKERLTDHLADL